MSLKVPQLKEFAIALLTCQGGDMSYVRPGTLYHDTLLLCSSDLYQLYPTSIDSYLCGIIRVSCEAIFSTFLLMLMCISTISTTWYPLGYSKTWVLEYLHIMTLQSMLQMLMHVRVEWY